MISLPIPKPPKQGLDYDDILEWAKSKHEYLVKEYGAE